MTPTPGPALSAHTGRESPVFPLAIAATLLCIAVVAGGGGVPTPQAEILVEIAALVALIAWYLLPASRDREAPRDRIASAIAIALIALPLLQLVPLPPPLWQSLGGRQIEAAALAAAGFDPAWMPISVAPYRTLSSLLSLIVPLTVFHLTRRLTQRERARLLPLIASLVLAAALAGAIQVISRGDSLHFYPTHDGYAVGFQANRNSSADVLLIGLIALAAALWLWRDRVRAPGPRALAAMTAIVLVLSLLLTGSRAGIVLLGALAIAAALLAPGIKGTARAGLLAALLALVAGMGGAFERVPVLDRTVQRFAAADPTRIALWYDAAFAITRNGPLGSGVGTVVPVMIAAERLEVVDDTAPNRVHNEYLEWTLEAGLPGSGLLLFAIAVVVRRLWWCWRNLRSEAQTACAAFAGATMLVIAAHAIVDYPLRSLSLAALCAYAAGLLTAAPRHDRPSLSPER